MPKSRVSVNRRALKLVQKLRDDPDKHSVVVTETPSGATVIDAGVKASGGFQAGKVITEICLGGCGKANICPVAYDDLVLPSIFVYTSYPAVSTLGCQFADWQIKEGDFFGMGSGPARALARKNRGLYEQIGYEDESEDAVLVIEAGSEPPEPVVSKIAADCCVSPSRLSLIVVPTVSVAGSAQVSGRVVETGLHKLVKLGLDPKRVTHAFGSAPVAPVHPKFAVAMGRTNDAILYGGVAHYDVRGYADDELARFVERAPSSASEGYGQPFQEIFKAAGNDFYKVDPNLFAPAVVSVSNVDSGALLKAGKVNVEVLKRSFGLKEL